MSEGVIDSSNTETTKQVKRAMTAMMIPQIWRMSPDHLFPVIIRVSSPFTQSPALKLQLSTLRALAG